MKNFRSTLARIIEADSGNNRLSRIYDLYMLFIIALSIIPLMVDDYSTPFIRAIAWITVMAFLLDFVARCYVAPVMKEYEGKPFYRRYPFCFMGLVDFLSIMPVASLISYKFTLFRMFRLIRIVALLKFTRYTDEDEKFIAVLKKQKRIITTIFLFTALYIFITALIMYNVEPHVNPDTGEVTFDNFFDALYWSTVTLTTVGYGDLCPVSAYGRIVSMISSVFGIGLIASTSSILTQGFIQQMNKDNKS
ncbi:MAG: ion transporter [Duncaniella sp.]|nr:ion transporter [Duncaniella sp.]